MKNIDNTLLKSEINNYLSQNKLSLRKFSKLVDIPPSTLSRIINSKQKPNITHIKKLSKLIPSILNSYLTDDLIDKEFNSAINIYDVGNVNNIDNIDDIDDINNNDKTDELYNVLKISQFDNKEKLNEEINSQFIKCKDYAKTEDGVNMIKSDFNKKINEINGVGPLIESLKKLYNMYILESPFSKKALIIGAVLLYFIIPLDVIPDYLFGIGYIDDMILLQLELSALNNLKI